MKMQRQYLILIGINVILCAAVILYVHYTTPKIGYIAMQEVYDNFTLKKELEAKLQKTENIQKSYMDTLAFRIKLANNELQSTKDKSKLAYLETQKEEYLSKRKLFSEQSSSMSQEYTKQIWNQLNQYVQDYGKKQHYDIILGGNGSGSIMHADQTLDITKQVKEYVNNRYKGTAE